MHTKTDDLILMKLKDVIKLLQKDGWYVFNHQGNLSQFRHPLKLGIITLSGNPVSKLAENSLRNIFDLAGI